MKKGAEGISSPAEQPVRDKIPLADFSKGGTGAQEPNNSRWVPFTSDREYPGEVTVVPSIPLPKEMRWYGLDAKVFGPKGSTDAAAARDDNLLTAWKCNMAKNKRCIFTLELAAASEICAIRLFATDGAASQAARDQGFSKNIRIHTDAGVAAATLLRRFNYQHVVFPECIATKVVSLEAVDTYLAPKTPQMVVSEVELLGTKGPKRAPMILTTIDMATVTEGSFWRRDESQKCTECYTGSSTAVAWMELTDGKGTRQRLIQGHQRYVSAGGRFILFQKTQSEYCPGAVAHRGYQFTLMDTQRRGIYLVRDIGASAVGGKNEILELNGVHIHPKKDAFAVTYWSFNGDGGDTPVFLALNGDRSQITAVSGADKPDFNVNYQLAKRGFKTERRSPTQPAGSVSTALRQKLCRQILPSNKESSDDELCKEVVAHYEWYRVPLLGNRSLIYTTMDMCGALDGDGHAFAVVLDKDNRLLDFLRSPHIIELRMLKDGTPLIGLPLSETGNRHNLKASGIYILDANHHFIRAYPGAAFELPASPGCFCEA